MQIVYTSFKKRKPKKPNAKQRELAAEWEQLLKKYETKPIPKGTCVMNSQKSYIRETPKIPSLPFTAAPCFKGADKVYTGNMIKGIGTMHKSNAVPIFSDEQAVEIAKMRRG